MTHYLALIHKDPTSCYGVSFPDVPGVVGAGDTLDEAIDDGARALAFAAEDWAELTGRPFPSPSSYEVLRLDREFAEAAAGAVIAAIPFQPEIRRAA